MLLDVPHAVVGQVTHQHLPSQVQDLVHHVPQPVKQIPLVLLRQREQEQGSEDARMRINEERREDETRLVEKNHHYSHKPTTNGHFLTT